MIPGSSRSGKTESTFQPASRCGWPAGLLIPLLAGALGLAFAQEELPADTLLADLGCSGCHPGVDVKSKVRSRAPDLSHAGLRYQEGYLFNYLQHPVTVRRHIGLSRMPDFHFRPEEALALVLFLERQRHVPRPERRLPPVATGSLGPSPSGKEVAARGREIVKSLECTACHTLFGEGTPKGVDLSTTGYRLKQPWLRQYLVDPARFDGDDTPMPASFFHFSPERKGYEEIVPGSSEMLAIVASYLSTLGRRESRRLQRAFDRARAAHPGVDHNLGERIFLSQNCAACHEHNSLPPWRTDVGPDLSREGNRVTVAWLKGYLKRPVAVRPFGFHPGSGSRMPDFFLTEEEAEVLTAYLSTRKGPPDGPVPRVRNKPLSLFERQKARYLIEEKMSCLGCHRLGGRGGRIGPALSDVSSRLRPGFIYRMISDPRNAVPGAVMPRIPMPETTVQLVTRFLLDETVREGSSPYLSLVKYPLNFPVSGEEGADLYGRYCAGCHGPGGDGNGFNREFLPAKPAALSDPLKLSQRPDDTLFDAIYSGGFILDKSPLMPPFGHTLGRSEIRRMVAYLREMCGCRGPEWSRNEAANP